MDIKDAQKILRKASFSEQLPLGVMQRSIVQCRITLLDGAGSLVSSCPGLAGGWGLATLLHLASLEQQTLIRQKVYTNQIMTFSNKIQFSHRKYIMMEMYHLGAC